MIHYELIILDDSAMSVASRATAVRIRTFEPPSVPLRNAQVRAYDDRALR